MSADPTPPPSPEPAPPTPGEPPIETLPQKRRHRKAEPAAEPVTGDPDNEIIVLSSLLQSLLARKQGGGEANETVETETRGKINRFVSRKDAPAASLPPFPVQPPPGAGVPVPPLRPKANEPGLPPEEIAAPDRPPIAGPAGMAAIAFPKFEPRSFQAEGVDGWGQRTGSTWGRGVLYFAFTAGLALAAFLAGRNDAHHADTDKKAVPATPLASWTPTFMDQLDKALADEQAGNLTAAHQVVDDLEKSMKPNPVLDAYAATIDTRLGRLNDVEATLSRRLGPATPPEVAVFFNQAHAFNYARRREFDHASDQFAEVAKVRPFDATNFLLWGEAQRRMGRISEAVEKFRQALLRLPIASPSAAAQREYVAFKQRLSLIELGREAELKTELDQNLNAPAPSGYWLLTGAAVALQKGDMPAAVDFLKKAQATPMATPFNLLLEDYFFRAFAYRPEMLAFLASPTPEELQARRLRLDYFIDP